MPYLLAIGSRSLYIMKVAKDSGKGSHLELCTDSVGLERRLGDKNGDEALNPLDAHDKRYGK